MSEVFDHDIPFTKCSASAHGDFLPLDVLMPLDDFRARCRERSHKRLITPGAKLFPHHALTAAPRPVEELDFAVDLCRRIGELPSDEGTFELRVATLVLGLRDDAPWTRRIRSAMAVHWMQQPYKRHLNTSLTDRDGKVLSMRTLRSHPDVASLSRVLPALSARLPLA